MSITIDGVPDHLTREDYLGLFRAVGFEPEQVQEMRFAADGVHVIAFARDEQGKRRLDVRGGGFIKHRVFIPVRDDADQRTTRITTIHP